MKLTARIATTFETGGAGARSGRSPLALAATLCASVALLLAVAAPAATAATATDSYGYLAEFGSGELRGFFSTNGTFAPIAVDSHGNILVASSWPESPGESITVFEPDAAAGGTPLTKVLLGSFPADIAIDPSNDSIYVRQGMGVPIHRYLSDGNSTPTYSLDPSFEVPYAENGIAVDPTTHDLLLVDQNGGISRYNSSGALVSTIEVPGLSPTAIAAAPDGSIYISANGKITHVSGAGLLLGELATGGGIPAVNPMTGNLLVAVGNHLKGYSPAGNLLIDAVMPISGVTGVAIDGGSGRIYTYTGGEFFGGAVYTFAPAKQPGLDPPVVSQITPTTAHLEAKVAPGGEPGEATKARIEYCPATATCANPGSWVRLTEHEGLSGGEVAIEDDLAGLLPNSEYLVRVTADRIAADGALTDNTSATTTFNTPLIPPEVHTGLAGAITESGTQLSGTIATYGDQTTYRFEYGLTTNYGSSAPAGAEGVAGSERATRTFTRAITGLQPGTEYHYRLVAHNSAGEAAGEDRTFTTIGTDEVAPGRAYEQVTPVDKRGSTLRPGNNLALADGSAIVYGLAGGATDSESAVVTPRYLSRRGEADWNDWQPLDPPLNIWRAIIGFATQAVSDDLTHSFVVSNRSLAPGAIEDGPNIYIQDLQTGAYSLVGSAEGLEAYIAMNGLLPTNNFLAGAPDFSWVILASRDPLLPGVTGAALYKWTETGGLEVESYLPGGSLPSGDISMLGGGVESSRYASDDGNTMYFAIRNGPDTGVYRRADGATTAISVSQVPGDPSTPFPGEFDGTSRDGRYAFFRSPARLTPDAPSDPGGNVYLYRYDAVTEDLTYIGPAVSTDGGRVIGVTADGQTIYYNGGNEGTFVWRDGVSHMVTTSHPDFTGTGMAAGLSPSGRYLAYLENDDVRLYDADTDQSVCVSCRPDGSPGGTATLALGDRDFNNSARRVVTDGGTVFFDTTMPLVPADHNGRRDVYSYRAGLLTLISPGDGNFDATFADASADGSSVFFLTSEPLVGQDTDGEVDIYDARIGGGFPAQSPSAPPASCIRSECGEAGSGPLSSPPVGSSASQSPAKPRKHCPKGTHARKVKGKTRCVKPAKHKKKAKRANTNRRQGR